MKNRLEVVRSDFLAAFRTLRRADRRADALLAFEGRFLSIEADDRTAVMHATGEWHGRARFSGNILRALAEAPPAADPVVIEWRDGKLRIDTLVIGADWEVISAKFIGEATNPDYLDLIAMDRTLSRAEIHGSNLNRKISTAKSVLAGRVAKAAKLLEVADITEGDIWNLVDQNIRLRALKGQDVE